MDPSAAASLVGGPSRAQRLGTYGPLVALGVTLARRGILSVLSMVVCALTVAGMSILAFVLAGRGGEAPVHDVPLLASSALAWGGGFLHAFSASVHAFRRDRSDGIRDLLSSRTTTPRAYLVARVGGLALLLVAVVGGGTLVTGLASSVAATSVGSVAKTLQATLAALAFAVAFSVVVAPLALAALGARSRMGGYLFLLGVVVLPEILVGAASAVLPPGVAELLAIPAALDALRASLAPGSLDPFRFGRALLALVAWGALAVLFVQRDVVHLDRAEPA